MENRIKQTLSGVPKKKAVVAGGVLVALVVTFCYLGGGTTSKEAFINGRLLTVLSPLPGVLSMAKAMAPGDSVRAGQRLGEVVTTEANDQIPQLMAQRSLLDIELAGLDKQVAGLDSRLSRYQGQLVQYRAESQVQHDLGKKQSAATFQQLKQELKAIRAQTAFSSQQLKSYEDLYQRHFISRIEFEQRRSENLVLKASQQAKAAELEQRLLDQDAALSGLQLSGPRTLDAPQQNQRDLALTIENMTQEKLRLLAQQAATRENLRQIVALLASRQQAALQSSASGVVWNVVAENGASVQAGGPVMQVLDCQSRWVEAFFDEADAGKLRPGRQVKVKLTASPDSQWAGTIRTVRAGSGRVAVGERTALPPPEIARRQLPVKVVTAHIDIDWKTAPEPATFCLTGRSVTVAL
ncbi:HlyD family secretion protein [Dryocola sp. BD626]|uniref:HlyD family secretion protein n=1 Tax=Dryocola sp. BD626 TaxID=3133273 RepID=UPI003F508927